MKYVNASVGLCVRVGVSVSVGVCVRVAANLCLSLVELNIQL